MYYNSILLITIAAFISGVVLLAARLDSGHKAVRPLLVDLSRLLFPLALFLLVLRAFLLDYFIIPSHSMLPTLQDGDYILVNKFAYGLRLPVLNRTIFKTGAPNRGDVIAFRYPENPQIPYIKRVIGVPGDSIVYRDRSLSVNGIKVPKVPLGIYQRFQHSATFNLFESVDGIAHRIVEDPTVRAYDGSWLVPEGSYFVMGDNRDGSHDSRDWGFVPERDLLGQAFLIWLSRTPGEGIDWARMGQRIL